MSARVGISRQGRDNPSGIERRAWVRYTRHQGARVRTETSPTRVFGVAVIRQVSVNGLGVYLGSRLQEGTVVQVDPQGPYFPRALVARVVHARPEGDGWYHGCELMQNLSEIELKLLLS